MGSDHRTVRLKVRFAVKPKPNRSKKKIRSAYVHWKDVDIDRYKRLLDDTLRDTTLVEELDCRCKQIEELLVQAACQSSKSQGCDVDTMNMHTSLTNLVQLRQASRGKERTTISKAIQKEMKAIKRIEREAAIHRILEDFKGLKRITNAKTSKRKSIATHMLDASGKECTDRQGIADIFAAFYEQLYSSRLGPADAPFGLGDNNTPIPPFSRSELTKELNGLKNGKTRDGQGVFAELLKFGGPYLVDVLLDLYNQIISPAATPPSSWKNSMVTVIFKSGDSGMPGNYRPITIIPLLYKLFARLLYTRLYPILDEQQCEDQAGFRRSFSTLHHLSAFASLQEKCNEWQVPAWISTIDFAKAFDTVEHSCLWSALQKQGVPSGYIRVLSSLYEGQTAQVRTDRVSRPYSIMRGTKQGDPLSSLLFNSLLEDIMREVKPEWVRKHMGLRVGHTDLCQLTNLRFADDLLLVAKTLPMIRTMLSDIAAAAARRGLELHPGKTKIMTNCTRRCGRAKEGYVDIGSLRIEVMPFAASVKYLGAEITFANSTSDEVTHRIGAAWRKFMTFRDELTNKRYSLNTRIKLFSSVVSTTMLYGCAAWTLTKNLECQVRRTQRRMLRMILGSGRRTATSENGSDELEPWVDWVRRTTHEAEARLKKLNLDDWVTVHQRVKIEWARKLATEDRHTWAFRLLAWEPDPCNYKRAQARPRRRWLDDITDILERSNIKTQWHSALADHTVWQSLII